MKRCLSESVISNGAEYSMFICSVILHVKKTETFSKQFQLFEGIAVISPTSDFANVTFANVFGRFANATSRFANVLLLTSPTPNI